MKTTAIITASTLLALAGCVSTDHRDDATKTSQDSVATQRSQAKVAERLAEATQVIRALGEMIPTSVAKQARCVAVVPAMAKAGFVVGAEHGRGFATCRTGSGWSAPAPLSISGGSAGLQIGAESVDLTMVITSEQGRSKFMRGKLQLGADISASAGPMGRGQGADTDSTMKSEVLTYSRSRGLFAGAELGGAVIEQDDHATRTLYGTSTRDFRSLLDGTTNASADAGDFLAAVRATFGD